MPGSFLGRAIAIAANAHRDATDKGGRAYILHPLRVMMRLRTDDEELMCIAVLHDVVEDSPEVTRETLIEDRFSSRVIGALDLLTHDPNEPYDAYIRRVATNRDAALVKLEDLRDNSDITRLKGLREKDFERLEKYHRAFVYLRTVVAAQEEVGYALKRQKYEGVPVDRASALVETFGNPKELRTENDALRAEVERLRNAGPVRNDGFQDP